MSSPGPSTARNTCKKDERMELKFKVPDDITWKKEAAACDKHNCKDESITIRNRYPKPPVPYFEVTEGFNMKKILEFMSERSVSIAKSIANDIIIPDPAPEKIFLDTTRLLAEKTNNLLEELWNYIEDGKLIQSAVLLLAAQDQIRGRYSSKINGSSKKDGFDIINKRILRLPFALRWEKGSGGVPHRLLDQRRALLDCTGLLVDVISHVGEPLSAYIQTHSEVSCAQVLEHVSSILKEYGFCPTREVMDTKNLQPYDCKPSDRESHNKEIIDGNSTVMETANLHAASEKVARKKLGRGWDPTCTRRCFFPYWRSVLRTRCPVKVYPTYARADTKTGLDLKQFRVSSYNSMANASTPTPNHKHSPVGRISPLASKQLKRSLLSKKKKKKKKKKTSKGALALLLLVHSGSEA